MPDTKERPKRENRTSLKREKPLCGAKGTRCSRRVCADTGGRVGRGTAGDGRAAPV